MPAALSLSIAVLADGDHHELHAGFARLNQELLTVHCTPRGAARFSRAAAHQYLRSAGELLQHATDQVEAKGTVAAAVDAEPVTIDGLMGRLHRGAANPDELAECCALLQAQTAAPDPLAPKPPSSPGLPTGLFHVSGLNPAGNDVSLPSNACAGSASPCCGRCVIPGSTFTPGEQPAAMRRAHPEPV